MAKMPYMLASFAGKSEAASFTSLIPLNTQQYNVPESNCFADLLQHGGQLVAHPTFGFRF
jgi:hypothetical protein